MTLPHEVLWCPESELSTGFCCWSRPMLSWCPREGTVWYRRSLARCSWKLLDRKLNTVSESSRQLWAVSSPCSSKIHQLGGVAGFVESLLQGSNCLLLQPADVAPGAYLFCDLYPGQLEVPHCASVWRYVCKSMQKMRWVLVRRQARRCLNLSGTQSSWVVLLCILPWLYVVSGQQSAWVSWSLLSLPVKSDGTNKPFPGTMKISSTESFCWAELLFSCIIVGQLVTILLMASHPSDVSVMKWYMQWA